MTRTRPAGPAATAVLVVAGVAALAVITLVLPLTRPPSTAVADPGPASSSPAPIPPSSRAPASNGGRARHRAVPGEADGVVPDGVTVFDRRFPAVARLDPDLLTALRAAAVDAARDGVTVYVTSGWRSPAYQDQLLREAIARYGSAAEAARWVATAATSPHVSGQAVDLGHADATDWLSEHGARYGLCRIYRNEPWHYELRPQAVGQGCPRMYADPTHDPRMHR